MCLLGCDIGSSSVKASIVDKDTGLTLASDFYPKEEAAINSWCCITMGNFSSTSPSTQNSYFSFR